MRYTLSNRQEKALHLNAQPITLCLPLESEQQREYVSFADADNLKRTAAAMIAAEGIYIGFAELSSVTVRLWTGPRQQPHGLADILGEIETDSSPPLRPGFVRSSVEVLWVEVYSVAKAPQKDPAPPAWPADFIPDGEARPWLKAARESHAAGVELLREGQRQGDYDPPPGDPSR